VREGPLEGGRLSSGRRGQAPNEVWTVDFKGWWRSGKTGRCEPLTIRDEFSRYVLELRALDNARSQTVREAFGRIFERHGLPEAIRFTQYAKEEWAFEKTAEYTEIQNYWLEQYRDKPVQLNLPIDFPRPAIRTYKSQRDDFKLDPVLIQSLKKLGARAGSSLVSTLLCSFEIFLSRLTGQEDIVLGLPVSGQSATGNHALVGHCVHLLLLRSQPKPSRGFLEFLKERKSKILDDYDHQRFTFGSLLKKLNIARDPSRVPLVPVVFNMDMGLDDGVSFEGLRYELFYNPREYENFEISLSKSYSWGNFMWGIDCAHSRSLKTLS
jgi:hypothetical protein